jgi:hypothetical protein
MTAIEIAETVRRALVEAAVRAYDDAGVRGLCEEGRWEVSVDAMRSLDLAPVLAPAERPDGARPR